MWPPNESRLSCAAQKKDPFPNLRAASASSAGWATRALTSSYKRQSHVPNRLQRLRRDLVQSVVDGVVVAVGGTVVEVHHVNCMDPRGLQRNMVINQGLTRL